MPGRTLLDDASSESVWRSRRLAVYRGIVPVTNHRDFRVPFIDSPMRKRLRTDVFSVSSAGRRGDKSQVGDWRKAGRPLLCGQAAHARHFLVGTHAVAS